MFGLNVNAVEMLEEKSETLLFLPAAIFGYLFYLINSTILLWIAAIWTVLVSLLFGIERSSYNLLSTHIFTDPIHELGSNKPTKYEARTILATCLVYLYAFPVGPFAIISGVNNLLPESQEIPIGILGDSLILAEILQGTIVANDLVLILLLGINLISYTVLIGPNLLWIIIISGGFILNIIWTRILIPALVFVEDRFFREKEKY